MPLEPPVQETATIAGAAGGFVLAMASAFNAIFGPKAPERLDHRAVARVVAEAVCCWLAGVFGAAFVAPALCLWRGIVEVQYVTFVGFAVGGTFWTLIPLGRYLAVKWLSAKTGVDLEVKK